MATLDFRNESAVETEDNNPNLLDLDNFDAIKYYRSRDKKHLDLQNQTINIQLSTMMSHSTVKV